MSTSVSKELLGFQVNINGVATSLAELGTLAGSEERALALANNYIFYHVFYGEVRDAIVAKLVELTGIKLLTKKNEKTGKEVVDETNEQYIGRLEDEGVNLSEHAAAVAEAVNALSVNYAVQVRSGGGGGSRLAKKYLVVADAIIEQGKVEAFANKYGVDVDGLEGDELKVVIANKVKELQRKAEQEAAAKAVAL